MHVQKYHQSLRCAYIYALLDAARELPNNEVKGIYVFTGWGYGFNILAHKMTRGPKPSDNSGMTKNQSSMLDVCN